MKLNAIGVTAKDITKAVAFYELLGFKFDAFKPEDDHVEAKTKDSIRLMIDSEKLMKELLGYGAKPANHSAFAIEYDLPDEVDEIAEKVKKAGYELFKEPWDAFWGQRYCIVKDPNGYMIDLYATL